MTLIDRTALGRISPLNPAKRLESTDPLLQAHLPFTDKESYLAWRAEWRALYAELSQEIRDLRGPWRADRERPGQYQLFAARALARTLLALRQASKVRAEQLYQEAKAQAEVA